MSDYSNTPPPRAITPATLAYARAALWATTLATPGQRVTHHDRPRPLGPTEHLVRCSSCSEPTIVLLPDGPDGPTAEALDGVRCGACLRPAEVPPCPR